MNHPKEFANSPLIDAVLEIRFDLPANGDLLPGLVYSKLRKEFTVINELPNLQLPLYIRQNDPALKYQATHRLESEDYYLLVGPTVLGLGCKIVQGSKKYPGWKTFSSKFLNIIKAIEDLEFIGGVNRIGCRFINVFQRQDLFADLNLVLKTGWEEDGLQDDKALTIVIAVDKYTSRVAINTNVTNRDPQGDEKKVQLIDIDTFIEGENLSKELKHHIEKAHVCTEDIFFKLLKDEMKSELGAKYE